MANPVIDHYAALLDGDTAQPEWLSRQRRQALSRVQTDGLPTRRQPAWHYSPVDQWLAQAQQRHGAGLTAADPGDRPHHPPLDGTVFHFSHGWLQSSGELPEGVGWQALSALDPTADAELIDWLTQRRDDSLAALADALAPDARVLSIHSAAMVERPLVLHHRATQAGVHAGRLVLHVAAGAHATVVEYFEGADDCDYTALARTVIRVDRDARLTYVRVNGDGDLGRHLGMLEVDQQQGSEVRLQALAASGHQVRNGININLLGEDARFQSGGVLAGSHQQHIDYHLSVNHLSDRGVSDTRFQGLAGDEATGIVNGRLYIGHDTHANDAQLSTHNLLLSSQAEINAKPELEIHADELSCGHGATVGQLDAEQLHYLRSRGIARDEAIDLLTSGFLRNGLLELGEPLQPWLESQITRARQRLDSQRIDV